MNNNFIVIKLTDNGNKNEQIKSMLKNYGAEVIEDAIVDVFAVQKIPNELFYRGLNTAAFSKHMEERLAHEIKVFLEENKLITYSSKTIGPYMEFLASINVLALKEGDNL